MTAPRCLLWDIDGTLIDTTDLIVDALDHVYRTHIGRTLPRPEIRALIGTPLASQVTALGAPEAVGASSDAMVREFIRYYEVRRDEERLIPPALDTLRAGYATGHATGLVTSKNRAEIANSLPRLGIDGHVHLVVTADDVALPKPAPDGILAALAALGVAPDDAVYIGDTVHDMRAGERAGVRRCAVTWGAALRPDLLAEAPDMICDDPRTLAAILGIASAP